MAVVCGSPGRLKYQVAAAAATSTHSASMFNMGRYNRSAPTRRWPRAAILPALTAATADCRTHPRKVPARLVAERVRTAEAAAAYRNELDGRRMDPDDIKSLIEQILAGSSAELRT